MNFSNFYRIMVGFNIDLEDKFFLRTAGAILLRLNKLAIDFQK